MPLAANRLIRYVQYIRVSGTETPHPIESIEVLGPTTRHQLGGGCSWAELAGRRLV
jgi:hypothetical protein